MTGKSRITETLNKEIPAGWKISLMTQKFEQPVACRLASTACNVETETSGLSSRKLVTRMPFTDGISRNDGFFLGFFILYAGQPAIITQSNFQLLILSGPGVYLSV